ncbi:hypothetical protein B6D17_08480 [Gilliamella apis]|uniref:DUF262 domain-containing protein n=1 Tax=Gilliamella apis TaxID=1970738 RepID=UPI000A335173|nr:DUF262 domain-containing protein [Gilliamella apis]OTQ70577.1 hypothetical protein B6D17_08480 [Gilliamella apis]OTQ73822.1 hypothetical protein B6C90_09240 [Gilliamella apis]
MNLEEIIAYKRNSLKADRLDMSFGELMSMYEDGELFITPEYQRVFRWSLFQQTRFIESVLLGIPIPPIFVAEDKNGNWEVVDGLQRMSTIFAFFGILKDKDMSDKNFTKLCEGEMVKELQDETIDSFPLKLKTTIKRAICRVEIVRWDSQEDVRYELFNRLNTGASPLSEQEIRNCIFRSYPVDLNQILIDLAKYENFIKLVNPTKTKQETMYLEELVLRYFAFKHLESNINKNVPIFLTEFMRKVSLGEKILDLETEKSEFKYFVDFLLDKFQKQIFRPKGQFVNHIFDSLAYAISKVFKTVESNENKIEDKIKLLLNDENYEQIGTSTFSNTRIRDRMDRAKEIFESA